MKAKPSRNATTPQSLTLPSRAMSRQLAQVLAEAVNLENRPVRRAKAGTILLRAGQVIERLPFIVSGRLGAVLHLRSSHGEQVVPVTFLAGEVCLMSFLFNRLPSGVDLIVGEDAVIKWMSVEELEAIMLHDHTTLVLLVQFLGQRLREAQARERGWAARAVVARVSAGLLRMATDLPQGQSNKIIIESTHEALAFRCGVSRPKASIALKKMEQAGLIALGRCSIEILDVAALQAQA
jgi:CRP-like cAMP-binding protein